ncbi:glycoside hydrolase family 88 protein [Paenibacillus sp. HN-1]|uniref:glycoside hydrolase family 88 protein n=1 Tax=Paenibacillus TaxID=44249 RepID=UPI001CA7D41E|nr:MULTISPECIES: glycoside hydrolase family 88 protein [Paenibacillus]MBY9077420.1 glycoside hydrolase family 88 protein [Paenibacillus sp. CGMCC 1.18879]MBY9087471.1 glycoside hydrolase family 88 protein [Paenibacillus sinensis]
MNAVAGPVWVEEAWEKALEKTRRNSRRIGAEFPHASQGGKYVLEAPHWWTAGFWPGMLWQLYAGSGDESLKQIAERCEERLDEVLDGYVKLDHDLGFMWILTSVANYKLQGGEASRVRALKAANYLAARFNLKGRYIRAWNPWIEGEKNSGVAIIDCSMNVNLLFWVSRISGDPRYRHIAEAHMDTVLEHFIRQDGSVYHIVNFNPDTGEVAEKLGGQGYAPESAWSRGTAWALYGMALAYHHTGKRDYLYAAQRVAHFFLTRLPEDKVPHWDFRAPGEIGQIRDTSAGACAASGLLLLASLADEAEAHVYRDGGVKMLESLYRHYGTWDDPDEEGLLLHGTSNYPENRNIDVPLIYGDFFYVEALARLRGDGPFYWE